MLDCANGAAYNIAPLVFTELGADVITLNNHPDGLNINKDCGSEHPEVIRSAVLFHNADIGIALDGDADRVVVVDEKGNHVDGDIILGIVAAQLKKEGRLNKNTVVGTVMSNLGLEKYLETIGVKLVKTAVGDRYVVEEMKKNGYNFGGEQSGHIIFFDYATTGDGIISALQILKILKDKKQKLSVVSQLFKKYPQVLINVDVREKKDFAEVESIKKIIKESENSLGNEGRVLVRCSGTQNKCRVMVEGKDEKIVTKFCKKIADAIKDEFG